VVKRSFAIRTAVAFLLISLLASTSGCFDVHTARRIFYPPTDDTIVMKSETIAQARYDYMGPVDTVGVVRIGAAEFHREIDNFIIADGGGNLYLWVQAHFFQDSGNNIPFQRYINVTLSYIPSEGDQEVNVYSSYASSQDSEVNVAEQLGNVIDPEPGLWSLKVEGVGTATVSGGVTSYDSFKVTVNGVYSSDSYNNNAPGEDEGAF
jgi:hypothetical protein